MYLGTCHEIAVCYGKLVMYCIVMKHLSYLINCKTFNRMADRSELAVRSTLVAMFSKLSSSFAVVDVAAAAGVAGCGLAAGGRGQTCRGDVFVA